MTTKRSSYRPGRRILRLEIPETPASKKLTEAEIADIIARAMADGTAAKATRPKKVEVAIKTKPTAVKVVRPALRSRTIKTAGTFPCRRKPGVLASILWPVGVIHQGCGRTYTTEKTRDRHEAGTGWDPVMFPHGCLDRILPAHMRDTR
jgi:hypothetical protein